MMIEGTSEFQGCSKTLGQHEQPLVRACWTDDAQAYGQPAHCRHGQGHLDGMARDARPEAIVMYVHEQRS